ncbi:divalent-cation tolerance protein CutA [Qipengyuania mesophila]|uniref:Divalent-cation tolerance protein CutA n=1 Tax=Qipengyuania mesophila TaxID=2867246 RepID=A0ABS7JUN3_9SPHN|nr:divalent-cation tolerance protein CutA [Qipengyuania mesophila]MBX7501283.1 divalent-cation tolerance protein CutA [Qipengyuania mesophila]
MTALIYCPFPDAASAETIGRTLIDERLIACINIGGPVRSIFAWKGAVDEGEEVPCLLKTTARLLERAIARLEVLHPYEAPAITGWHCDAAGAATQAWLDAL